MSTSMMAINFQKFKKMNVIPGFLILLGTGVKWDEPQFIAAAKAIRKFGTDFAKHLI